MGVQPVELSMNHRKTDRWSTEQLSLDELESVFRDTWHGPLSDLVFLLKRVDAAASESFHIAGQLFFDLTPELGCPLFLADAIFNTWSNKGVLLKSWVFIISRMKNQSKIENRSRV